MRRIIRSFGLMILVMTGSLVAPHLPSWAALYVGMTLGGLLVYMLTASSLRRTAPSLPEKLVSASWIMAIYRREHDDDPAEMNLSIGIFQMNERVPAHAAAMMFASGAANVAMGDMEVKEVPQGEQDSALLSNARLVLGDLLRTYDHVLAELVPGPTRDLLETERTFYRQQYQSLGPGTDEALLNTIVREYARLIEQVQRRAESA